MIKRLNSFLNKRKTERLKKQNEIRKKLPKGSFSRKFYGISKDLKKETIIIKSPGGHIIYNSQGYKNKVEIPVKFLENLKKNDRDLSKLQLIHNHTISKKSSMGSKPSFNDIRLFLDMYRQFDITNFTILFIDKYNLKEFGRIFLKLDSLDVMNKLKNFKNRSDYNIWFKENTLYFGKPIEFISINDLKYFGFKYRFLGLNGHKYNSEKEIFQNK
ncbi:MAG: hypothetical protein PHR26_01240 [Candidatus ainarchaeum sp.]|nr:hypothetical protein [Candidatus ainarchaeum sp.]MDD3976266.1 hypothetical protein [Candidatus ainarchaeum sp.]